MRLSIWQRIHPPKLFDIVVVFQLSTVKTFSRKREISDEKSYSFRRNQSFVLVSMYVVVVECELAVKQKATCTCMLQPNASRLILHYVF